MKTVSLVVLVACSANTEQVPPGVDAAVQPMIDAPVVAMTPDAPPPPECTAANDTCTGERICIAEHCEAAFGRVYDIRALEVVLSATDPNGNPWDNVGGSPDPFVTIFVNGVQKAQTPTVNNAYVAAFPGPYQVIPVAGGRLAVWAYDEDLTTNELAFPCSRDPLTAETLRQRMVTCTGIGSTQGSSLKFRIEPH